MEPVLLSSAAGEEPKKKKPLSLIAVQSLLCFIILLLCLGVKLRGGSVVEDTKTTFFEALGTKDIATAVAEWFDQGLRGNVSSALEEENNLPLITDDTP